MLKKFFIILFFYNIVQIFEYVKNKYSYQYEDWLINYSNGFVRRGLVGDLLFKFFELTNINLSYLVLVLLIIILALFYKKSYDLLSGVKLNKIFYFLLFSPFFYFFYLVNHNAGIRKEFLLYIFFVFLFNENNLNLLKKRIWLYSLIFPILILIHEGLIFYLPFYILFLAINLNKQFFTKIIYNAIIVSFFSILITLFSLKYNGSDEHVFQICQSLKNFVKETCIDGGAIKYLNYKLNSAILEVLSEHNSYSIFQWTIISLYGFFPIFYILYQGKIIVNLYLIKNFNLSTKTFIILFLSINFLSILPLFVIAFDWGRWLSIYYHLSSFFLIYLFKSKILILNKNYFDNLFKNTVLKKSFIFILLIFGTFLTPAVFDKVSDDHLNPYKFNYVEIIIKIFNIQF